MKETGLDENKNSLLFLNWLTISLIALSTAANATPLTITDPNSPDNPFQIINQYGIEGPSSWGGAGGIGIVTGFGYVSPGGKDSGTFGFARQNGVTIPLLYAPVFEGDSSYFGFTQDTTLTGSWELFLQNGLETLVTRSPSINTTNIAPTITGLRATNLGSVTPTFVWDEPGGQNVSLNVAIYDVSKISEATGRPFAIFSEYIEDGSTEYTIPEGLLSENGLYTFSIRSAVVRTDEDRSALTGTSLAGSFESLNARFFDFATGDFGSLPEAYLPEVDKSSGEAVFIFNNLVKAGLVEFYDPIVSIGYEFAIGIGNPNFASVLLPILGDNIYELYIFSEASGEFSFIESISGGIEFLFDTQGVERFKILGIEAALELSPDDPTAFVTGLSFTSNGHFTGTMRPITAVIEEPTPVPGPGALPLLISALLVGSITFRNPKHVRLKKSMDA